MRSAMVMGGSVPRVVIPALAVALAAWLAAAGAVSAQLGPVPAGWAPAGAPAGVDSTDAEWIEVAGPDGHTQPAAVFRLAGPGPWPVVVVLHGAAGLPVEVLPLARSMAAAGFLTVAGCWHAGGPPGPTFAGYVDCSEAPPLLAAAYDPALRAPRALVAAARTLPGARADRVGVLGISLGGYPAVALASSGPGGAPGVRAAVAQGGIYAPVPQLGPPLPWYASDNAAALRAPLLILHGTADTTVPVQQGRDYELAARGAGAPVEAHYYEGVEHLVGFLPDSAEDARRRTVAFFGRYLAGSAVAPVRLPRTGAPGALGAEIVPGDVRDPASLGAACHGAGKLFDAVQALDGEGADNPRTIDAAGNRALNDEALRGQTIELGGTENPTLNQFAARFARVARRPPRVRAGNRPGCRRSLKG
jgi:dienelactone hydrolase